MAHAKPSERYMEFSPFLPRHMMRGAIVRGLAQDRDRRDVYAAIIAQQTVGGRSGAASLAELVAGAPGPQERVVRDKQAIEEQTASTWQSPFLWQYSPWSSAWKPFHENDYQSLTQAGLIINYSDDVAGLAEIVRRHAREGDTHTIIAVRGSFGEEDIEWRKHVSQSHVLKIDGIRAIRKFAAQKGINLPQHYLDHQIPTTDVLTMLKARGFSFLQAFESAIEARREEPYNRQISQMQYRNPMTGEPTLTTLGDLVFEGPRHYAFFSRIPGSYGHYSSDPKKYRGTKQSFVPKRTPYENRSAWNEVTMHFLPDFANPREDPEGAIRWWFSRLSCNCGFEFDCRNIEYKEGFTRRVVTYTGAHCSSAILDDISRKRTDPVAGLTFSMDPRQCATSMVPIPTPYFADIFRFMERNVFIATTVRKGDRERTVRRPLHETERERLLQEVVRQEAYDTLFVNPLRYAPHDNGQSLEYVLRMRPVQRI